VDATADTGADGGVPALDRPGVDLIEQPRRPATSPVAPFAEADRGRRASTGHPHRIGAAASLDAGAADVLALR
jgi:hypothetical protein